MKIPTRAAAVTAAGISLCLTLSLKGQQPRKVDDAALKSAGKSGDEWLSYGLTPGETRYSPLKQIDATKCSLRVLPPGPRLSRDFLGLCIAFRSLTDPGKSPDNRAHDRSQSRAD